MHMHLVLVRKQNLPHPDQNYLDQHSNSNVGRNEHNYSNHSPTSYNPFQREVDWRSLGGSAHSYPLRWLIRCQTPSECPPDLERCSHRLPPSLLYLTSTQRLHKPTQLERKAAARYSCVRGQSRACGGNAPRSK